MCVHFYLSALLSIDRIWFEMNTRYGAIAQKLLEDIGNGRYHSGELLPTEVELCAQYDVSRHTVRAAMRELENLGRISRKKGVGTRVEEQPTPQGFSQSLASVNDLTQFAKTTVREIKRISPIVADKNLGRLLGCKPGSTWIKVSYVRRETSKADALILSATDIYIDERFNKIVPHLKNYRGLYCSLIEAKYGKRVIEIQQKFSATILNDRLATECAAEFGSPALQIVRRYIDTRSELLEASVTIHPADRYTYESRLRRLPISKGRKS